MLNKALAITAMVLALFASPTWALFETHTELAYSAKITLQEAIHQALVTVPGKAIEAEIGKDEGRTVYEIEIIDSSNKTQKVYVDAQNGDTKIDE